MQATRFDTVTRALALRRRSRRSDLGKGGAGFAVTALAAAGVFMGTDAADHQAGTAMPAAEGTDEERNHLPESLFLQTFQGGTIEPTEGAEGRYTVTLAGGTGQTIYFSDRRDHVVGTNLTERFLQSLAFDDDNPPNAAMLIETASGKTDIAVVELFAPEYDPETHGLSYEVGVLDAQGTSPDLGLVEEPTDLAALAPAFGSAHLFIDGLRDCPDLDMECVHRDDPDGATAGIIASSAHDGFCYGFAYGACMPCQPWNRWREEAFAYWAAQCNERISACDGDCVPRSVCSDVIGCG